MVRFTFKPVSGTRKRIEVLDISTTSLRPDDDFGEVSSGYLVVTGHNER